MPPWDTRAQIERAFEALGIKYQYRQVDLSAAGSLLQSGGIDGFGLYSNGEASVPPWIAEASLATDWAAVNPSAAEIAALRKAGFAVIELKPEVFKRDVHTDKVVLLPFYYGFHVGLEVSEDDMYQMLKVVEKNLADLVKADSELRPDRQGHGRLPAPRRRRPRWTSCRCTRASRSTCARRACGTRSGTRGSPGSNFGRVI